MPRRSRRLRERQDAMETVEDVVAMENAMDTEGDAMPIEYAPSILDSFIAIETFVIHSLFNCACLITG